MKNTEIRKTTCSTCGGQTPMVDTFYNGKNPEFKQCLACFKRDNPGYKEK
jgi:hypothetical protein